MEQFVIPESKFFLPVSFNCSLTSFYYCARLSCRTYNIRNISLTCPILILAAPSPSLDSGMSSSPYSPHSTLQYSSVPNSAQHSSNSIRSNSLLNTPNHPPKPFTNTFRHIQCPGWMKERYIQKRQGKIKTVKISMWFICMSKCGQVEPP